MQQLLITKECIRIFPLKRSRCVSGQETHGPGCIAGCQAETFRKTPDSCHHPSFLNYKYDMLHVPVRQNNENTATVRQRMQAGCRILCIQFTNSDAFAAGVVLDGTGQVDRSEVLERRKGIQPPLQKASGKDPEVPGSNRRQTDRQS